MDTEEVLEGTALRRAEATQIEAEIYGPVKNKEITFPREPYPSQRLLANAIREAARGSRTAVFESPTGTGKTLAVLCAVLECINDLQLSPSGLNEKIRSASTRYEEAKNAHDPNYKEIDSCMRALDKLNDVKKLFNLLNERLAEPVEAAVKRDRENRRGKHIISDRQVVFLGDTYVGNSDEYFHEFKKDGEECQLERLLHKVYYVSRTHSQLTQFIRELDNPIHKNVRAIQLGSRKAFCLNKSINGLPSTVLNCECAKLVRGCADVEDLGAPFDEPAKPKRSRKDGCPYFNMKRIYKLRNDLLAGELKRKSIHELGEQHKACPFYASKAALPFASVVAMPYNMLFDKACRKSYDIIVDDNYIIVDEAHNFINIVQDIDSFNGNLSECEMVRDALKWYSAVTKSTDFHKTRCVRQTADILDRFIISMRNLKIRAKDGEPAEIMPSDIMRMMETSLDLIELTRDIEETGLLAEGRRILSSWWRQKHMPLLSRPTGTPRPSRLNDLLGRVRIQNAQRNPQAENNGTPRRRAVTTQPRRQLAELQNSGASNAGPSQDVPQLNLDGILELSKLRKLFESLTSIRQHRFLLKTDETFRYIRLDLNDDILSVIRNARTFIMMGGTMRPKGFIASTLYKTDSRIAVSEKQFPHVVAPQNLYPIVITNMPGVYSPMSFYTSKLTEEIYADYAEALTEVFKNVPHGVVVFFPNYAVIPKFYERLKNATTKEVFMETKESNADELLERYKPLANSPKGAVMLASAAGKLGEGINFADNLARGVVMVGLPYPNIMDPEIQLRAKHAMKTGVSQTVNEYLDQCCIRVVAQCMGRAIRHANDYAALVFMDARYKGLIAEMLPEWMTKDIRQLQVFAIEGDFKFFFHKMALKYQK